MAKGAYFRLQRLIEPPKVAVTEAARSVPRTGWFMFGFLFPFFLYHFLK